MNGLRLATLCLTAAMGGCFQAHERPNSQDAVVETLPNDASLFDRGAIDRGVTDDAPRADVTTTEPRVCPINIPGTVGGRCEFDGQNCGSCCCGTDIVCRGGVWVATGLACGCACMPGPMCGEGRCGSGEICRRGCFGRHDCVTAPVGCRDCSCAPTQNGAYSCEIVDGEVALNTNSPC